MADSKHINLLFGPSFASVNEPLANTDEWAEMAKLYKKMAFAIGEKPIGIFLDRANALLPFSKATGIHDNGSGPGPVITQIINKYGSVIPKDCTISASDLAPSMVAQLKKNKEEAVHADPKSPWARVDISVLNAMDLKGIADDSKSHVTAGWVYFMTPDPQKCLTESRRVLRADGVLALSSWQSSEWMEIQDYLPEVRAGAPKMEFSDAWKTAHGLRGELEKAGYRDIEAEEVPVELTFETHDSMIDMFAKMPHIAAMKMSKAEKEKWDSVVRRELKKRAPTEPGRMNGVCVIAVGRK